MFLEYLHVLNLFGQLLFLFVICYGVSFGIKYHLVVFRMWIADRKWENSKTVEILNEFWRYAIVFLVLYHY